MDTLSRLRAGELAGARRLDLRCSLDEFPREILDLWETLEVLNLSGNRLSALPGDLDRLKNLRILFCSENEFTRLPEVLGRCPSLEMVGFKSNRIETIDATTFSAALRWLILTDNRIEALPGSIGDCTRLRKLMLAGNRLESLPEEMARCVNLELVRLSANRFAAFPDWLFRMPRLAWLGLGGNAWTGPAIPRDLPEIPWDQIETGEILGEGASGVIRAASLSSDGNGNASVAVKLFKGAMTSDGLPENEMNLCLAAGNHPNLVGVIGRISGHPDGARGLVMPRVDPQYTNLAGPPDFETCTRDVYDTGTSLEPVEILRIAKEMAAAGGHLHGLGILHGDFYAHNILRHPDGHCLLGDFGAACIYPEGVGVEKIEVRAFGCLLEELLSHAADVQGQESMVSGLRDLLHLCLSENVESRPDFKSVQEVLAELAAASSPVT